MRNSVLSRSVRFSVILLAECLLFFGCGKKVEVASRPPEVAAQHQTRALYTNLQTEMDSLRSLPHEHDLAKRTPVLSEKRANRRDWAANVLQQGFTACGKTNSPWEARARAAFEAYADYSRAGSTDSQYAVLTNAVLAATEAGCADPMIQYMLVRYGLERTNGPRERFALASMRAFRSLITSPYHPVFKFLVGFRAVEAAREIDSDGDRSAPIEFVTMALEDLARDTNASAEEVFEPASWWADYTHAKGWLDYMLSDLEPILEKNWGGDEAFFRWRGQVEVNRAWAERGSGFADTVTPAGWEQLRIHLSRAETALDKAWQMNTNSAWTAYWTMQVELGQGRGRPRMEQWFERAMALSTNFYDAVKLMSFYLEPRWYGSEHEALEFGRACVASTNWGGRVPLILADLHHSLAAYSKRGDSPEYWQRPEVWNDVRAAYERFFQLNPDAFGFRHNYARDAYLCGHYAEFVAQAKLFPWTNFEYFGGEEKFKSMLQRAASSAPATGRQK